MSEQWWPAPAKLNLFLHVLGRREDGYHELETVFQLLDHADLLRLVPRADGVVRRVTETEGVDAKDDLAVRAARLLAEHTGCTRGVDISVRKRIPMAAGLGGGSSDAATVLLVLNRLWGLHLPVDELARLGQRLGADVPVFVRGHTAYARGIGELLQPVRVRPCDWFAVCTPDCEVPTAAVFGSASLTRNTPESTIRSFLRSGGDASEGHLPELSLPLLLSRARNDCETIVSQQYRPVNEALERMAVQGPVRLTGTGASVFAPCVSETEARARLVGLPGEWRSFVARGLDRSPLLTALAG